MEHNEDWTDINKKNSLKRVFLNHEFFKLWFSQFVSNVGTGISFIVLPLFIFSYTDSTFWLGFITFIEFIPILIISPVAGVVIDSYNRKLIMICSDILNTFFTLIIPLLMNLDKVLNKNIILTLIMLMVFLGEASNRFFMPARVVSIPIIVNSDDLGVAISISETTFQIILTFGPILGVIIITLFGYWFAFVIDGITFILSAIILSLLKTDLNPNKKFDKKKNEKSNFLLGLKKLYQIKSLKILIILMSFFIFTNSSISSLLVAFVKSELSMSDIQFGILLTIYGLASIISGLIFAKLISNFKKEILLIIISYLLKGLILLPILIITKYWQLYLMFIVLGPINQVINISVNIIIIRKTTDDIRGQVFSSFSMIISLFSVLGIIYGVAISSLIGLRYLYFTNALLYVFIAIGAFLYLGLLNKWDYFNQEKLNIT